MSKIALAVIAVCLLLAAGYSQLQKSPRGDAAPRTPAAVGPAQDSAKLLLAMKGVKKYCVDDFQLASCMVYYSECQTNCLSILPVKARTRMLTAYNHFLVKHGQKPYRFAIPSQQHESIIGQ